MGSVRYGRHFCLLAVAALLLGFAVAWRPQTAVWSAGLYGSLHALLLVVCLRSSATLIRKALFIAAAGCLTMASLMVALELSRFAGVLPFAGKMPLALGCVAGVGAAGYVVLVRRFWIAKLPLQAAGWLAFGCVLATTLVFQLGTGAQARGGFGLVAAWWFAFSGGLMYCDTRIEASMDR